MSNNTERLDDLKVIKGNILKVWNTEKPKFSNANNIYYVIHCEGENGEFPIMLTERELNTAKYRATRNPEDIPKKGWFTNLLD